MTEMIHAYFQIVDANINRVSEGLRVIEEYARFIAKNKEVTAKLASLRKQLNALETAEDEINNLKIRNTEKDMRAKEVPAPRQSIRSLLKANFKRVEEGLRVLEEYTKNPQYNTLRYEIYQLEKEIVLNLLKPDLNLPGVYLVSDKVEILKKGIEWGVSAIQLRDKQSAKAEILKKAYQVKEFSQDTNTAFLVNDYLDIAQLVDADGFHSGQDDLPLEYLRGLLGPHKLLGRTCHTIEQGLEAEAAGADYVSVGPIWSTPSKPNREGIGFSYLKEAEKRLQVPFVCIGGVSLERVTELLPYKPPLLGLIRDFENIPKIMELISRQS